MAYTSPELVRRHLDTIRVGDLTVAGQSLTLAGTAAVQLPHRGLRDGSLVVTAQRDDQVAQETVVLTDDWITLVHQRLVAGSVVLATDDSLATVYVENRDFVVDHIGGRIRRLATGTVPSSTSLVIFYQYDQVFVEGDDFTVDYDAGTLARRAGGTIADGQTVTVDYVVPSSIIPDTTVEQAIAEAGDTVLALIDERYYDHPAPGIVIAETHLAVAIICRIQAASVLTSDPGQSGNSREIARVWLDLAERYERTGRERLVAFAAPVHARRSPRIG